MCNAVEGACLVTGDLHSARQSCSACWEARLRSMMARAPLSGACASAGACRRSTCRLAACCPPCAGRYRCSTGGSSSPAQRRPLSCRPAARIPFRPALWDCFPLMKTSSSCDVQAGMLSEQRQRPKEDENPGTRIVAAASSPELVPTCNHSSQHSNGGVRRNPAVLLQPARVHSPPEAFAHLPAPAVGHFSNGHVGSTLGAAAGCRPSRWCTPVSSTASSRAACSAGLQCRWTVSTAPSSLRSRSLACLSACSLCSSSSLHARRCEAVLLLVSMHMLGSSFSALASASPGLLSSPAPSGRLVKVHAACDGADGRASGRAHS